MRRTLSAAALGLIAISAVAYASVASLDRPVRSAQPVAGPGKDFVDEFESLDQSLWSVSDGWSNGPYMVNDWRKSQSRFDDDLVITLENQPSGSSKYRSGEVQSKVTYGHGYYEVTMQAASGSGIISGFFSYTGPPFGKPWNEIDVEILGKNTREALLTYFYEGKSVSETVRLDFDAAQGLHHYAFDWQPGYIRWYINGTMVHEENGSKRPLPNEAQKIMMHLWGTDSIRDWAGPFDSSAVPTSMRVGCVAYSADRPDRDKCR